MAANVCSSKHYNFTVLIGLLGLWIATIVPVSDAAQKTRPYYIFITAFEDVIMPKQVVTTLMNKNTDDTPDPIYKDFRLTAALAAARVVFDNAIFETTEFRRLRNAFRELRGAGLARYGEDMEPVIFCGGPVLAPSRLAALARLCETELSDSNIHYVGNGVITIDCSTESQKGAKILVTSINAGFDIEKFRRHILSEGAVENSEEFEGSQLKNVSSANWIKMYKDSKAFRALWRRIRYSVFLKHLAKEKSQFIVFSIGSKDEDVINLGDAGNDVGYSEDKVLKQNSLNAVNISVKAIAEQTGDVYVFKNSETTFNAHSVIMETLTANASNQEALENVATLLDQSSERLFGTDAPAKRSVVTPKSSGGRATKSGEKAAKGGGEAAKSDGEASNGGGDKEG